MTLKPTVQFDAPVVDMLCVLPFLEALYSER
jgi:hypothetical protein